MELNNLSVKEYLEILASEAPAPGGGSASALSGAQGAALAEMVANLTLGKPKYAEYFETCTAAAAKLKQLREALLLNVELDANAFMLISSAYRLPKNSDAEKALRKEQIQLALVAAARLPLDTMELARDAALETKKLCGSSNTSCSSDLGVAALMLKACAAGAKLNVEINISALEDETEAARLQNEANRLIAELESCCDYILTSTV